jgi:hypothetical protein
MYYFQCLSTLSKACSAVCTPNLRFRDMRSTRFCFCSPGLLSSGRCWGALVTSPSAEPLPLVTLRLLLLLREVAAVAVAVAVGARGGARGGAAVVVTVGAAVVVAVAVAGVVTNTPCTHRLREGPLHIKASTSRHVRHTHTH